MQRDPRGWLWDVQAAVADIRCFVQGLDAAAYASSNLVHSAVERKFEIIGEALSQLSKANPELAQQVPGLRQIVGFRNQLIHGYAKVDHATVWEIATDMLPPLRQSVDDLLARLGPPEID